MKNIIGISILMLFLLSCAKVENLIPNVPVNFSAPLTDPRLSRLSTAGGAVSLSGYGVAGLIIYRRADNAYVAFDRCSTVNPTQKNAVVVDDPTITATDHVSGAKYSLYDGSAVKAPAKTALKQYQVTITGNASNGTIYISN
jgi:nitrite reductase/ring-hydroxylating ferredoxin subunit